LNKDLKGISLLSLDAQRFKRSLELGQAQAVQAESVKHQQQHSFAAQTN
jgi:hypothetical protein